MAISIQNLEYFYAVSRCGSYRAAADKLFRSYQTVYQSVHQLEDELGSALFVTENGQLVLTDFGQYVMQHVVMPLLDDFKAVQSCREDYLRSKETLLRVDMDLWRPEDAAIGFEAADVLQSRFKQARILCEATEPKTQRERLRQGTVDLIMQLQTPSCAEMKACLSIDVELLIYLSPRHRLAQRQAVTIDDVRNENFLFHNPENFSRLSFWEQTGISLRQAVILDPKNPLVDELLDAGKLVRVLPQVSSPLYGAALVSRPFDPPLCVKEAIFRHPSMQPTMLMKEYVGIYANLYRKKNGKACTIAQDLQLKDE